MKWISSSILMMDEARRLCADLRRRAPDRRSIVVTGCVGGEGASTLALALAGAATVADRMRTLVIDANPTPDGLTALAGEVGALGLRDIGPDAQSLPVVKKDWGPGVYLLPNGGGSRRSLAEFAASSGFERVAALASEQFDLLLWDSGPVCAVSDTKILLVRVPDAILVTQSDRTRLSELAAAVREIATLDARILAVVRNRAARLPFSRLLGRT